jgi:hypothetical protein
MQIEPCGVKANRINFMNTAQLTPAQERAAEYAKNYPVLRGDGLHQPVTVANVVDWNGRRIFNLACKTAKSGRLNATYSCPIDWDIANRFKTGDIVMVEVLDGLVKKIHQPRIETVKKGTGSLATAINEVAAKEEEQAIATTEPAVAAEPAKAEVIVGEGDMPF